MRAVDDDDGNLTNGTPHGGALFAAFNRHGIACTTDTGAITTLRRLHAAGHADAHRHRRATTRPRSPGRRSGTAVYDVFRNETGCNAGFTKIASGTLRHLARRHQRRQRPHLLLPGDRLPERQRGLRLAALDLRLGHSGQRSSDP